MPTSCKVSKLPLLVSGLRTTKGRSTFCKRILVHFLCTRWVKGARGRAHQRLHFGFRGGKSRHRKSPNCPFRHCRDSYRIPFSDDLSGWPRRPQNTAGSNPSSPTCIPLPCIRREHNRKVQIYENPEFQHRAATAQAAIHPGFTHRRTPTMRAAARTPLVTAVITSTPTHRRRRKGVVLSVNSAPSEPPNTVAGKQGIFRRHTLR
jgi:hypothetical protein